MPQHLLFVVLGAGGLYLGAEWLVRGAAGLARALGVSPLAVGLTVVAYGTSMPELVVSTVGAVEGKSDLALGNVVGSNLANLGVILGLTAIIAPPTAQQGLMKRELPVMLGTTLVLPLLLWDGRIGRVEGLLLLAGALWFTRATLRSVAPASTAPPAEAAPRKDSGLALAAFLVVGLGVLLGGGKLFVDGAVGLARAVGMSERLVGLTVVAFGTSLPEFAASVVAALRGQSAIAVGNVLGSNIFNVLLILGVAAAAHPIVVPLSPVRLDLTTLGFLSVAAAVSMRTARTIQRAEGALLLTVYAAYLVALALTG